VTTSGSGFSLQFDARDIADVARRYAYATDHRAVEAGRRARKRGYYTKPEFMIVCRWKSPRSSGRAEANPTAAIHRATRIALGVEDEATRIQALTDLQGVGVPVASTLLYFAFPRRYPILDWRALASLGHKPRSTYSISFWLGYLDACRRIARENHVSIRTLDKALWQHSRETTAR